MSKCCRSKPIYGALGLETSEEKILQQYKFLKKAQESPYLNEFIKQSLVIENFNGLLGKISKNIEPENEISHENINRAIMDADIINLKSPTSSISIETDFYSTLKCSK